MKKNISLKFLLPVIVVVVLTGCLNKSSDIDTTGKSKETQMNVSDISTSDYGKYVDLGTDILDLNIKLSDGTLPKTDWRVFYKDSNGIWLMMSDFMPNTKFDVKSVGIEVADFDDTYKKYNVRSSKSRASLIEGLNGDWKNLIKGSYVSEMSGVEVKGAIDLEKWVASWNEKYPKSKIFIAKETGMKDTIDWGWFLSRTEPAKDTLVDMKGLEGYIDRTKVDSLYFTHTEDLDNCFGYWLSSPSAQHRADGVIFVGYTGKAGYNPYSSPYYGVRPVVYLPSDIKLDTSGEVWKIVKQ